MLLNINCKYIYILVCVTLHIYIIYIYACVCEKIILFCIIHNYNENKGGSICMKKFKSRFGD